MNIEYLCGSVHCNDEEALIELCNKYHYDLFKIDNNYYDIESYGTRYEHIQELKSITYDIILDIEDDDGSLYRITDKTKEKAVTIYPSDLCGELKKWAIKNSDVIEILGRIEQDV